MIKRYDKVFDDSTIRQGIRQRIRRLDDSTKYSMIQRFDKVFDELSIRQVKFDKVFDDSTRYIRQGF